MSNMHSSHLDLPAFCLSSHPRYCPFAIIPARSPVHLTEEAGNLLQWMLMPNPYDRPTLAQVMWHDWVANEEVQPP